jgi:outer membrane receptor for ferrienterochelin and colicins
MHAIPRKVDPCLLYTCIALALPSSALAQEADILEVLGSERAVMLATGYPEPVKVAPGVTTVITAEDIRRMGATNIEQVLETVPGLHVSTADAISSITQVRGINSRLLVMLNGIPLVQGLVNAYGFWNTFPLPSVERVEVLRGPASALYGADAASGVVNIITKKAQDIRGTELGARAGSFDTYDAWWLQSGRLGDFDVALALSGFTTAGYDATIEADAQTALDRRFRTHASLAPSSINTGRDVVDARLELSDPSWTLRAGYLYRFNIGTGVGVSRALDPEGHIDSGIGTVDLTRTWRTATNLDLSAQLAFVTTQTTFDLNLFPPGAFRGAFPEGVRQVLNVDEYRVRSELTALYRGLARHVLRFGVGGFHDWFENDEDRRNYTVRRGVLVPTPAFAERGGINDVTLFPSATLTDVFAYAQDEWALAPDWTLTTGLRLDHYSDFGSSVNPRAGLVWNVNASTTAKLLYGRAFRAPSFIELESNGLFFGLGNPDLQPSTLDTVELAANRRSTRLRAQANATVFWYRTHDTVVQVPSTVSPNGQAFENGGGQEGYGFELDTEWEPVPRLKLIGRYAYQEVASAPENVNLRFAPRQQVYAEANWRFAPRWNFNVNVKSVFGRERQVGDPRPPVDDYAIVTVGVRRESPARHLEVAVYARNLFNQDAREPSDSPTTLPFDIPLPGREIYGEVRVRF